MTQDKGKRLAVIIGNLSENLFGDDFEVIMLRGLSSLFRPSSAALVSWRKDGREDFIRVVELKGDKESEDVISEADFARKYGFRVSESTPGETPLVKDLSETPARIVISFLTGKYHSLIHMTDIGDAEYLSDEHITLLSSLIGLAISARYSIKNAMRLTDPEGVAFWGHRIKSTVSSIRTAVDMLMGQDFSEADREELKELVYKGVSELTEIVDTLLQVLHLNGGSKS